MKKSTKPKKPTSGLITIHIVKLALLAAAFAPASRAMDAPALAAAEPTPIRAEDAWFLASGQGTLTAGPESFVIPVSGAARIAEIRQYLDERARGVEHRRLIATCVVRLGSDGENRNHSAAGAPLWDWHVSEYLSVRRAQPELELYPAMSTYFAKPSDIKTLLETDAAALPDNIVALVEYPIVMELKSEFPGGKLINVSTRGWVGMGDHVMIAGFVVEGGTPRNVVVRVLGPSLAAFDVPNTLSNPRVAVYRGAEKIAENDDWVDGNLNRPVIAVFPPPPPFNLVPHDNREPALELTLEPGAYTMIVSGVNNETGVALAEVSSF